MDLKPKAPNKKNVEPVKELDQAIVKSKKTKVDTKSLDGVNKEFKAAAKELGKAMTDSFQTFQAAYKVTGEFAKKSPIPPGIPIPYPNIDKAEKSTKAAVQAMEKVQKKHDKVCEKAIKIIEKQMDLLQSSGLKPTADEAGTLKGLISAQTKIKTQWVNSSFDVKFEGKNVVRHFDLVANNLKKVKKK